LKEYTNLYKGHKNVSNSHNVAKHCEFDEVVEEKKLSKSSDIICRREKEDGGVS
jgi:hypothetical protein